MYSLDLEVFHAVQSWLQENKTVYLCTVTATWGSAPRDVGSLMACNGNGQQCGSLSGGCIEEDLLEKVSKGEINSTAASHIIYGETKEEAERLKLPCGGTLGVLIEPLTNSPENNEWIQSVIDALEDRQCITREKNWRTGEHTFQAGNIGLRFDLQREGAEPQTLHQVYGPQFHLLLIGVSEVTRYLAEFALMMDYRVSVCDPRPEQIQAWQINHVNLIQTMPDDCVLAQGQDNRTAILALTHDPRIDDMGLMEAFNTDAFYIGAMGSMATSAKRRERLASLGISEQDLARLHAPIGLSIGSKTPAEIAIAILAELTQVRAKQ